MIFSEDDGSDGVLLVDEEKSFLFSANFDSKLVLEALVLGLEGVEGSLDKESLEDEKGVGNFLRLHRYCYSPVTIFLRFGYMFENFNFRLEWNSAVTF